MQILFPDYISALQLPTLARKEFKIHTTISVFKIGSI
jgi:hypothetical protein